MGEDAPEGHHVVLAGILDVGEVAEHQFDVIPLAGETDRPG